MSTHSWSVWLLGAIVGVVAIILALLWLGLPRHGVVEATTALVGMILVMVPAILDGSDLALDGWASCIIGNVLVVGAGWLLCVRIAVLGPSRR